MLVHASYLPYPPLGLEETDEYSQTQKAYAEIASQIYAAQPDVLLLISKPENLNDTYSATLADTVQTDLSELGEYEATVPYHYALNFVQHLKEEVMKTDDELNLLSKQKLPFGVSVVLHNLHANLKHIPIASLYYSMQDNEDHFEFGKTVRDVIEKSNSRIAVVAIGNLSHCVAKNGIFKYNEKGKEFDETVQEALLQGTSKKLVYLDDALVKKARECGLKSLLIELGILHGHEFTTEILGYEHPHGIGYLSANFKL